MEAYIHLIVVICFCLGAFLGGFFIDLDHSGTLKEKWKCFISPSTDNCHNQLVRGIFHNPKVAFSIIALLLGFTISYFLHIIMDNVVSIN